MEENEKIWVAVVMRCKIHHKQRIIATIEKKLTIHGKDAYFDEYEHLFLYYRVIVVETW